MIELGFSGSFSKTITESDVNLFAGITGDFNPLHINEEEAKKHLSKQELFMECLVGALYQRY